MTHPKSYLKLPKISKADTICSLWKGTRRAACASSVSSYLPITCALQKLGWNWVLCSVLWNGWTWRTQTLTGQSNYSYLTYERERSLDVKLIFFSLLWQLKWPKNILAIFFYYARANGMNLIEIKGQTLLELFWKWKKTLLWVLSSIQSTQHVLSVRGIKNLAAERCINILKASAFLR